jgi:hypothetical protein
MIVESVWKKISMYIEKELFYKKAILVTTIDGIDFYKAYKFKKTLISKCGRIFSQCSRDFKRIEERFGYLIVRINNKRIPIHKMLAWTFIKGGREGKVVNHKDFDKRNNSLDNLEWITPLENLEHALQAGRISQKYFNKVLYGNWSKDKIDKAETERLKNDCAFCPDSHHST